MLRGSTNSINEMGPRKPVRPMAYICSNIEGICLAFIIWTFTLEVHIYLYEAVLLLSCLILVNSEIRENWTNMPMI